VCCGDFGIDFNCALSVVPSERLASGAIRHCTTSIPQDYSEITLAVGVLELTMSEAKARTLRNAVEAFISALRTNTFIRPIRFRQNTMHTNTNLDLIYEI